MDNQRSKEERVALINLRRGIIAAVIAAAGFIAVAFINSDKNGSSAASAPGQAWLKLRQVQFPDKPPDRFRLVIRAGNVPIALPASQPYYTGQVTGLERAPLPWWTGIQEVSFELTTVNASGEHMRFESQEPCKLDRADLERQVHEEKYDLFLVSGDTVDLTRKSRIDFEVALTR